MIGRCNTGGGGGGGGSIQPTDAVLRVIAPAGSTVTISKGGVTMSDSGHENVLSPSTYDYYFGIRQNLFDSQNAWTVTATLGTDSASDTVIISEPDVYTVSIEYKLWLVKNGQIVGGNLVAINKSQSSSAYTGYIVPTVTYASSYVQASFSNATHHGGGMAYFPSLIDLSQYSGFYVQGSSFNSTNDANNSGIGAWTSIGSYQSTNRLFAQKTPNSTGSSWQNMNLAINLASFNSTAYVGWYGVERGDGTYTGVRFTNVWLQP